jgi:hypothetical protein
MAKHEIEAVLAEPNRMGPLALILCAMQIRWARGDMAGAVEFAEKAIQFTNAKLTSTEVNISHSLAARSVDELQAELAELQSKRALATASMLLPTAATSAVILEGEAEAADEVEVEDIADDACNVVLVEE